MKKKRKKAVIIRFGTAIGHFPSDSAASMAVKGLMLVMIQKMVLLLWSVLLLRCVSVFVFVFCFSSSFFFFFRFFFFVFFSSFFLVLLTLNNWSLFCLTDLYLLDSLTYTCLID